MSNVIYSQYILSKMINELDLGAEYLTYFMMQSDGKKKKSPCVVQETLLARSLVYSPKTSFLPQLHAHTRARARAHTHTHTHTHTHRAKIPPPNYSCHCVCR